MHNISKGDQTDNNRLFKIQNRKFQIVLYCISNKFHITFFRLKNLKFHGIYGVYTIASKINVVPKVSGVQ